MAEPLLLLQQVSAVKRLSLNFCAADVETKLFRNINGVQNLQLH
jgi:hypothetical protein